jgi:protein phosphatase
MLRFLKKLFRPRQIALASAGSSDTGLARDSNEDAFAIHPDRRLFIVADGMGGHNAGEMASLAAVKIIGDYFSPAVLDSLRGNGPEIRHALIKSFTLANETVIALASEKVEWYGMGCTLVVAYLDDTILHVCHVGDTRCYILSAGSIRQLTTDHTALSEIPSASPAPEGQREPLLSRHVVTRVIGYPFPEPPDYTTCPLQAGDRILLCTDGLWSMVPDDTILQVIHDSPGPAAAVDRLILMANSGGGPDNITGVAIFI